MKPFTMLSTLLLISCGGSDIKTDDSGPGNGGGNGEPVVPSCSWFSGDNCWKQAIREADDCLPVERTEGTFAPDYQTCSFDDGSTLELTGAADFDSPYAWSSLNERGFSVVDADGDECVTYHASETAGSVEWSISTDSGTIRYTADDPTSFEGVLTCPNQSSYLLDTATLSCPDAMDFWPFIAHSASGVYLSYDLQGGDSPVQVFTCRTH